jgi:hypothetical protein
MAHTFKVTKKVVVDSFPHFRKYAHFSYKVLDLEYEISIAYVEEGYCQCAEIKYERICTANTFCDGSYEITEDEFNETMARAYALINNKNQ